MRGLQLIFSTQPTPAMLLPVSIVLFAAGSIALMLRDSIRYDRERRTRAARRLNLEGAL